MYAHSEKYITTLKQTLSQVESTTRLDGDTYVCPDTLQSCLAASGAVLQAVDSVMKSDSNLRNSFCIVRPPGHHAGKEGLVGDSVSQGFCLVNNIAIGAYYALKTYPDRIKRVAIVDIDVHHGDGTQHIVAGNNDILFISLHAYDGEFYPRTGSWEERAECTNILNIPLEVDFNADIFFRGFMAVGYPALVEFQPDMIFVSAGFDARKGDSLTPHRNHLGLIDEDYYKIALKLGNLAYELCHGRLVSALEGGYGSEFLAQCTVGYSSGLVDASLTHWIHTNLK
jgi:acetoin utilization deacetylase AcuC-like enzyme